MFNMEIGNIENAVLPKDITGAAQVGRVVSLKGYKKCLVYIQQGAWAGGTPAVSLKQGTDIAFATSKALGFSSRKTKLAGGSAWTTTAVTSDTFNLPNTANTMNVIEINSRDLDEGYDCIQLNIATPGANADLLSACYLLCEPTYDPGINPNAD